MLKWFEEKVLGVSSFTKGANGANSHQQKKGISRESKVQQIQEHLDNPKKWPLAKKTPQFYDLIDWNIDASRGDMYGPIYLGGIQALFSPKKKFGAVLSIIDDRFPRSIFKRLINPQISHLYLPLDDDVDENIAKYFKQANEFIKYHQDRGIPVFIHCVAGKSRSTTLLANYLMKKYNLTALQALDMIKKRRQYIRPNDGFIEQLVAEE